MAKTRSKITQDYENRMKEKFVKKIRWVHPSWIEYFDKNTEKWRKQKPGSKDAKQDN